MIKWKKENSRYYSAEIDDLFLICYGFENGDWEAEVRMGFKITRTGKLRRSVEACKAEAEQIAREIVEDVFVSVVGTAKKLCPNLVEECHV